jgi:hypothetical protein
LIDLLAWLELVGRKELQNALSRAGLSSEPAIKSPELDIPRQKLFNELDFGNQFILARLLHADVRKVGESPELIGKLVQCYAHLGFLSQDQWGHSDKVFKARSLGYAQRMCAAGRHSNEALWHRAYALALAGQHALALSDLTLARGPRQVSEQPKGGDNLQSPRWLPVIEGLCRFDYSCLPNSDEESFERKLLNFVESHRSRRPTETQFVYQTAKKYDRPDQKADKPFDPVKQLVRLRDSRSSGHANPLFDVNWLTIQVAKTPEVRKCLGRTMLLASLNAETLHEMRSDARGEDVLAEPTMATMAKWIGDDAFLQAAGIVGEVWENLPDRKRKGFQESWSVLSDHPGLAYLKALAKEPGEIAGALRSLSLAQFDCRAYRLWNALRETDPHRFRIEFPLAVSRSAWGYSDLLARSELEGSSGEVANARRLLQISPYAPMARALLIVNDWNSVANRVPIWKLDNLHPVVCLALGAHYLEASQYKDAELYLQFAESLNDTSVDLLLAQTYRKSGQVDKWMALAKKLLSQGGEGVDSLSIRIELAEYYLKQKQYQNALLYAEAAADSWKPRAMKCVIECYWGLGEWELAELWNQRLMVTVSSRN